MEEIATPDIPNTGEESPPPENQPSTVERPNFSDVEKKALEEVLSILREKIKLGPLTAEDWKNISEKIPFGVMNMSPEHIRGAVLDSLDTDIMKNAETFLLWVTLNPEKVMNILLFEKELSELMKETGMNFVILKIILLIVKVKGLAVELLSYLIEKIKEYTRKTNERKIFEQIGDDWYRYALTNQDSFIKYDSNQEKLRNAYSHYLRVMYGDKGSPEYESRYAIFEKALSEELAEYNKRGAQGNKKSVGGSEN